MSRLMRRAETNKVAKNAVAIVTALTLVFMQTPVTWAVADQNAETAGTVASNIEEISQGAVTEVGVSFNHAYIVYRDQVVAEPATKMTIPEGAELAFQAMADNGYEVDSVVLSAGGFDIELAADANGLYRASADKLSADAVITVKAKVATIDGEAAVTIADSGAIDVEDAAVIGGASAVGADAEPVELVYSDDDVTVTATLTSAEALPEGAELVVTPVTADTEGYNYDAYMQALNDSASEVDFTGQNTLLYDIAFVVDGVEVQPAEGSVKIDIQFKSEQLTDDLNVESNADVSVVHLPLTDEAKAAADSTADAVEISSSDIKVEALNATATVEDGNQAAVFTANSFSIYAFTAGAVPRGVLASDYDATVSFTDTANASSSGPSGTYSLVMVLTQNGQRYYAVAKNLDTSSVAAVDLSSQMFGEDYNNGTAKYAEGDSLAVFVARSTDGQTQLQTWQVTQMADGQSPYGAERYDNGALIDGRYQVNITVFGAPAESAQAPTATLSAQSTGTLSAASVDSGWDGGSSADDIFNGYKGENPAAGSDTYDTILGNAVYFGIVADGFTLTGGDAETNVAAKTGICTAQTGNDLTNNVEQTFILANIQNQFRIKGHNAYVLTSAESAGRLVALGDVKMTVDTSKSAADLDAAVQGMLDHASAQSALLAGRADTAEIAYEGSSQKYRVDIAGKGPGTYYVTVDDETYANISREPDKLRIYKDDGQTIVFNVTANPSQMQKYSINGSPSDNYCNGGEAASAMNRTIVWNFVNATGNISINTPVCGVVLAPNATVTVNGTSAGWLVAKNVVIGSGEWHNVDQHVRVLRIGSSASLQAEKRINGVASTVSGFEFELFYKSGSEWISLGTAENEGASIVFDTVLYDESNFTATGNSQDYIYKMVEKRDPKTIDGTTYTPDSTEYYAKVTVSKVVTQSSSTRSISYNANAPVYYADEACAQALDGRPSFNNTTTEARQASGSIVLEASKELAGGALKVGQFSFVLKDSDGNEIETVENDADGNIAFSALEYDLDDAGNTFTYTISEVVDGVAGVTYDKHVETVLVTVADKGTEDLEVTATYDDDGARFQNKYEAKGSVQIRAHKELEGQTLVAEGFTFRLTGPNGVSKTATNDKDGNIAFDAIEYSSSDIAFDKTDAQGRPYTQITYTVSEVLPTDNARVTNGNVAIANGLSYDNKAKTVTVTVTDMGNGTLQATYSGAAFDDITFTNKYETVDISGAKIWADNGNHDGVRPSSVTIHLWADGEQTDKAVEVTGGMTDASWSFSFSDLPKYNDKGSEIEYTVTEDEVEGYTADPVAGSMSEGFAITNKHTDAKTGVTAKKEWVDDDNAAGKRSTTVKFQLKADGVNYGSATVVSAATKWEAEWTDLPKFKNVNDEPVEIAYTVDEVDVPEDYTAEVEGDMESGFTVTNTLKEGETSVEVTKIWADNKDHDKVRPVSIMVQLKADGVDNGEAVELTGDGDTWTHKWSGLPKYKDGKEISYTVDEVSVPTGYTKEVTGNASYGYVIKNTHEDKTTSVKVGKAWSDSDDHDGVRPDDVTVTLMAGNTPIGEPVTLNESNKWIYTWDGLEAIDPDTGNAIDYVVTESAVQGYASAVTPIAQAKGDDGTFEYVVTNSHDVEKVNAKVAKIWSDGNDRFGKRPDSVTVKLQANGEDVPDSSITLSASNGWTGEWKDLDRLSGGNAIAYKVVEDVPEGYTATYGEMTVDENGDYAFTVTNSYDISEAAVKVRKVWDDNEDGDAVRPASVTVKLLANGEERDQQELSEGNGWQYTWSGLEKNRNGEAIEYTVEEETAANYGDPDIELKSSSVNEAGVAVYEYAVTNSRDVETTVASVQKIWKDNANGDKVRPQSIQVQLKADGENYGEPVTLTEGNWSHCWIDLPMNRNVNGEAVPVVYSVVEIGAVGDYTTSYGEVEGQGFTNAFTITNSRDFAKTSVSVTKEWRDDNNADGMRPDSVQVQLKAGGKVVGEPVTLDASNKWSASWGKLPKNELVDGVSTPINYTVEEVDVPEGYNEPSYVLAEGDGNSFAYTVVNSRTTEKTSASVHKTWVDNNDQQSVRPDSVTVELRADGTRVGNAVTLNAGNEWKYDWPVLPKNKYVDGQVVEISYSVAEVSTDSNYAPAVEKTAKDGGYSFELTNTLTGKTSITALKDWQDDGNRDGKRPTNVIVQLLADGTASGEPVTLSVDNDWSYTWSNLEKYAGGQEITYTVQELKTDELKGLGYTASVSQDGNTFKIVNSYDTVKTDVTVSKKWEDGNDQDGVRPDAVALTLYENGKAVATHEVKAAADGSWSYTFEGLNKYYDNGKEIVYTVGEDVTGVPADYATSADAEDALVAVNTRSIDTVDVSGQKTWVDGNDQDSTRPDEITVVLMGDGEEIASQVTNAERGWAYEFAGLDKNRNGKAIHYTITEVEVPGYTTTVDGYNLKNTLDVGQLEISKSVPTADTTKSFKFTVTLSDEGVNGKHGDMDFVGGVAELTLRDGNKATAVDLPAGITYTVTEAEEDGYTAISTGAQGTIAKDEVAHASFVNTYRAAGEVEFKVSKQMNGRTLGTGEFEFVLEEDGVPVQSVKNVGGSVPFEPIAYESTGQTIEHTYTIREVVPEQDADVQGVEYDRSVYTVPVTATDKGDGTLEVVYGNGYDAETGVVFTNNYTTRGAIQLRAHKNLSGMDLVENQFTFQLEGDGIDEPRKAKNDAEGDVVFPELTFSQPMECDYVITELHPEGAEKMGDNWVYNGMTYDGSAVKVHVVAKDNGNGTMTVTATYSNGGERAEFTNSYQAKGSFNLSASKKMVGREFQEGDEFTFEVTAPDGTPMPENTRVTIAPTTGTLANVDFGTIKYESKDKGKQYTYTVREVGATTAGGVTNDEFNHTVTVTLTDKLDGTFDIQAEYSDGDSMAITNTYAAAGEANLYALKTLTGRQMTDREFTFELAGDTIEGVQRVGVTVGDNDEDGNATGRADFPTIRFGLDDLAGAGPGGKDFHYTIREVVPADTFGVTYDDHVEEVTVHVVDNGTGALDVTYNGSQTYEGAAFANSYEADDVTASLEATKILSGGTLVAGQFSFTLTGTSETMDGVNQIKANDADGKVVFDEFTYSEPGVYEYAIAEDVPEGAIDEGDGLLRLGEIEYDGTVHTAVVTVTDDGYGKLQAEIAYDGLPELIITNGFIELSSRGFEFDKYLFGGSGEFDFVLTAADSEGNARAGEPEEYGADDSIIDYGTEAFTIKVQNGAFANGHSKVVFPEIKFANDGDYYYVASEDETDQPGMMTDDASYLVHVTVAGGNVVNTTYELLYGGRNYGETTDLSFYNNSTVTLGFASLSAQSYTQEAKKTSAYPKVKKYLNGSTDRLVGGDFEFELVDAQTGDIIARATNDETGDVAFFDEGDSEGLVFTEAGTYRYVIREVAGDEENVIYDASEILLTVTVTETGDGLEAELSYGGSVAAGEEPAFRNTVEGIDITVQKVSRYGGEGLVDCTYALWMVSEGGDVMIQEAVSDEHGYITFKDVNLTKGALYYFKEVEAPAGHTVDPYRTAYFSLNADGTKLVLVEETASDGWHSANDNIEIDAGISQ